MKTGNRKSSYDRFLDKIESDFQMFNYRSVHVRSCDEVGAFKLEGPQATRESGGVTVVRR